MVNTTVVGMNRDQEAHLVEEEGKQKETFLYRPLARDRMLLGKV